MAAAERKGGRERSLKELQTRSKPASNNEQQIGMGTRSFLLLPYWTNNEQAVILKHGIYDFSLAYLHILHFYSQSLIIVLFHYKYRTVISLWNT